jgi:hypothetical protein
VHLLDQLMEATPFRRNVRLLIAIHVLQGYTDQVESIYCSSASVGDARAKADDVIQQKLQKIFADASEEEITAGRRRSQALLMSAEQKLASEAADDADKIMESLQRAGDDGGEDNPESAEEQELSEVEISRGAQLVNVEVRVGSRPKKVAGVVMPDPTDSKRFVLAQQDSVGELEPQQRKGRLRYVNPLPDGSWQALTG